MAPEELLQMIVDLRFKLWSPENPTNDFAYFVFEYCPEDGEDVRKTKKFKIKEKKKAYEYLEDQKEKYKEGLRRDFIINERIMMLESKDAAQLVAILSTPGLQLPQ